MNVYFASDFHLGLNNPTPSRQREKIIVSWLDSILDDTQELYLLGDIFDFWYEYKNVVPKGHVRLLGKLAEFTERNIPVHIFTGNHDMWMFGYLEDEIGAIVHKQAIQKTIAGKKFFLGHGDGLGPGDKGYKLLKKVFASKINQWLFARLHPNFAISLMKRSSKTSREAQEEVIPFRGAKNEWLVQYAERKLQENHYDYFLFGHRHLPIDEKLSNGSSRYINTGDWIRHFSYAKFDGQKLELLKFKD